MIGSKLYFNVKIMKNFQEIKYGLKGHWRSHNALMSNFSQVSLIIKHFFSQLYMNEKNKENNSNDKNEVTWSHYYVWNIILLNMSKNDNVMKPWITLTWTFAIVYHYLALSIILNQSIESSVS